MVNTKKRKKQISLPKFRFMAMSKLIGVIAFMFVLIITLYAMYEMHTSRIYDSLPQLIISAFGFASVYAGFYLTMAKAEHLEIEKTKRESELKKLKKEGAEEETLIEKRQQISDTINKLTEIMTETPHNLL